MALIRLSEEKGRQHYDQVLTSNGNERQSDVKHLKQLLGRTEIRFTLGTNTLTSMFLFSLDKDLHTLAAEQCAKFWCSQMHMPCTESDREQRQWFHSHFPEIAVSQTLWTRKSRYHCQCLLSDKLVWAEWWTGCRNRTRLKLMLFIFLGYF